MVMAFEAGNELLTILGDKTNAEFCKQTACNEKNISLR